MKYLRLLVISGMIFATAGCVTSSAPSDDVNNRTNIAPFANYPVKQ